VAEVTQVPEREEIAQFHPASGYIPLVAESKLTFNRPPLAAGQRQRPLGFVSVFPVALDGRDLEPHRLIEQLNRVAGEHGVGRLDMVENRVVGMKSRGVYETPGGTILFAAHRELESICLDRDTLHYKDVIAQRYAELIYYGQWYTPLRASLEAFIDQTQLHVNGTSRLKLYKGNVIVAGRSSPQSLYREDFATFGKEDVYDQSDAEGFITLFGLPMKVNALLDIAAGGLRFKEPDYSKFKRD
jgi:argininosuccinate synthase